MGDQYVREFEGGLLGKEQMESVCNQIRNELHPIMQGNDIDFDQFVYIMSVPSGKPDVAKAGQKDLYRVLYRACGMDCYNVRKNAVKHWALKRDGASPRSPRSVYRRA